MIEVTGLTKRYGEFTAVRDLSFVVRPGEVMGLVGPNGAGKTTTLRCVTGIIPPTQGSARIGGVEVAGDPVGAKRQLAFFPDEPRLFEYLTVWQHLNFVARLYGVTDWTLRAKGAHDGQPPESRIEDTERRRAHTASIRSSRGGAFMKGVIEQLARNPRVRKSLLALTNPVRREG